MLAGLSTAKRSTHGIRSRSKHPRARAALSLLTIFLSAASLVLIISTVACRPDTEAQRVRPRQLRDVPAQRLAFNFQADVGPPTGATAEEPPKLESVQKDFDERRKDEALLRTVVSPNGQRALALYGTADEPTQTFRIDLYSADGTFLRNLTPPDLAVVFQDSVAWSADGGFIAFIGRGNSKPTPSPTPVDEEEPLLPPSASPLPSPKITPLFAPLATFETEQVYLSNSDGYDLKPLTTRQGLIYFALSWAPDGHALAALACKESEWDAREREYKTPAGRPRLISIDGEERLLDDELAEAAPVWSGDSSKVATAFGVDVGVYDAAGRTPTQARIVLRERLLNASAAFDEKSKPAKSPTAEASNANSAGQNTPPATTVPVSFNPIVRLEWPAPEKLYLETAYVSVRSEVIKTFSRWHLVTLSPQAAVLR